MSVTLTVNQHWTDGKRQHVVGNVVITPGTVYATGGIAFPINVDGVFSQSPVVYADVVGTNGYIGYENTGNLYSFRYISAQVPGSSQVPAGILANGLLRIYSGGSELSPGAIPAAVYQSLITFYGIFRKNQ